MLYNIFMQVFTELNENKSIVLILGFFDGIHLGHQKVIESAVEYAKQNNLKSAVLTFSKHPMCVINNLEPKYIMQNRKSIVERLCVDYFYEVNFNLNIAAMEPEEYLSSIIIKNFEPKAIFTGFNHTFGVDRKGNPNLLKNFQDKFGYKYFEIPPQMFNDEVISSTKIRTALLSGDIIQANSMLGRDFEISGVVIEGQRLGRKLGYKTANIEYPKNLVNIPFGVYEIVTDFGSGIANFGLRPTVNNTNTPVLEVHILNFDKDIYNKLLSVKFVKMIRPERKFNSIEELKNQIKMDIKTITS